MGETIKLTTKIIDISYANRIDFKSVKKAGYTGAIIRTGYLGKTDTSFKAHIESAINAGMHIGAYCYIMSDTIEQARDEADECADILRPYRKYIDLPVFADLESEKYVDKSKSFEYHKERNTAILNIFVEWLHTHGYPSGIYTNPAMLEDFIDARKLKKSLLWLAHWTGSPQKISPYITKYKPVMWQYGTRKFDGIHDVDVDLGRDNILEICRQFHVEHF